jgi:hypothetical protein
MYGIDGHVRREQEQGTGYQSPSTILDILEMSCREPPVAFSAQAPNHHDGRSAFDEAIDAEAEDGHAAGDQSCGDRNDAFDDIPADR